MQSNETEIVKVRIWDGATGHISLETRDVYISFWPSTAVTISNLDEAVVGKFHTLDEDRQIERRPAEHIYNISLPLSEIAQLAIPMKIMLQEIKALKWRISGNSENRIDGREYNCAAFAYRFLMNAGIESKIDRQRFGRGHQLFLLVTAILAVVGGILKAKSVNDTAAISMIAIGVIGFTLKYSQACYSRFSTYHPLTFEQIPITPGRIKGLIQYAGAERIENDSTIARYPTFQHIPNLIGDIETNPIQALMQGIINFQYYTLSFFDTIQRKDNQIPLLLEQLQNSCQQFHNQDTLNAHLENAIVAIQDIMKLFFILSRYFDPVKTIAHLPSIKSHRFLGSPQELEELNQLIESSRDIQVEVFFRNLLNDNLFAPLYNRFPFTQQTITRLSNNQITGLSSVETNHQAYLLNAIRLNVVFLLTVVLQRNTIYLKEHFSGQSAIINASFSYSNGLFTRSTVQNRESLGLTAGQFATYSNRK